MTDDQQAPPRAPYVPDTSLATLGKRRAKWRRWAAEMVSEGQWVVIECKCAPRGSTREGELCPIHDQAPTRDS